MTNGERMFHIGLTKEDIQGAKTAILPGDPGRVEKIAEKLENSIKLGVSREFTSYLGELDNEKILVISTGIGGPSAAICIEELHLLGVENLIRVGTCGGMQKDIMAGDIIIAQAAIRQDGTSKEYVPIEFPAVGDIDLICDLRESAKELGYKYHTGVVQCKDSFYGQHSPEKMPISYELINKWEAWIKAGALASEMETATLYTVASTLRMKAATVLLVVWNQEREKLGLYNYTNFDVDRSINVAINAIKKFKYNK